MSDANRPKIPRNVLVVAFVALFSGFGQDLITPVLPAYLALIGIDRAGIGLIDGLLQGSTSFFRFVSGLLSDRFRNRKFFVFLGYTLSSVSRPMLAIAGSFWSIATLRFLDGVGKGTKDAPRDALVADSAQVENRGRAFGFHRLIDTAGSVVGPLVAAAFLFILTPSLAAYRLIFAVALIPGAAALALIAFGIKESKKPADGKIKIKGKFSAPFWVFTAGTTIAMLSKINDSLFLIRAHDIGISRAWIPVLFAGFTLLYALLSYPIGIWSDKIGKLPLIAAGWLVLSVVEFGFSRDPGLVAALALFGLFGLFYALTEGSGRALIADFVAPEARGSAYGIFYTVTGIALIAGGFLLGSLWDRSSPESAFRLSALGSLIGFLVLGGLALFHRKKISVPSIIDP